MQDSKPKKKTYTKEYTGYKKNPKNQFQKGHTHWKKGLEAARKSPVRQIRRMTKKEIAEIGTLLLDKKIHELREIALAAKDGIGPERSALQSVLATVVLTAFQKGDMSKFDVLLTRIVGKAPAPLEVSGPEGGPIRTEERSTEDLRAELDRLRKYRKDLDDDEST